MREGVDIDGRRWIFATRNGCDLCVLIEAHYHMLRQDGTVGIIVTREPRYIVQWFTS